MIRKFVLMDHRPDFLLCPRMDRKPFPDFPISGSSFDMDFKYFLFLSGSAFISSEAKYIKYFASSHIFGQLSNNPCTWSSFEVTGTKSILAIHPFTPALYVLQQVSFISFQVSSFG